MTDLNATCANLVIWLHLVGCSGSVIRTQDCQLRGSEFKSSSCCFENWEILFVPSCFSSGHINEYLAADYGGCELLVFVQ